MQSASSIAPPASMKNTSSTTTLASLVVPSSSIPMMKAISVAEGKWNHPPPSRTTQEIVTTAV